MKIVTSLSFQGQCREAFEFYAKVLDEVSGCETLLGSGALGDRGICLAF